MTNRTNLHINYYPDDASDIMTSTSTITMAVTSTVNVVMSSPVSEASALATTFDGGQIGDANGVAPAMTASATDVTSVALASLVSGLTTVPPFFDLPLSLSQNGQPLALPQTTDLASILVSQSSVTAVWYPSVSGSMNTDSVMMTNALQSPVSASADAALPSDSSNRPQPTTSHNVTVVPIVASVLSLSIFLVLMGLLCWWRHKRSSRQEQTDDDLEDDTVGIPGRNSNDEDSNDLERQQAQSMTESPTTHVSSVGWISKSPSDKLTHPRVRPAALDLEYVNTEQVVEDPFLTPTDQKTFPDISKSQIGLAITTTPTPDNSRDKSSPESSSLSRDNDGDGDADSTSIQTILHHPLPSSGGNGGDIDTDNPFLDPHSITIPSTDGQRTSLPLAASLRPSQPGPPRTLTLTHSDTPPAELAQHWIDLLVLEAETARLAAEDAAMKARELKRREQINW